MEPKDSAELIIYQISEVKNLVENTNIKLDNYQEKTNDRISALEKLQIAQDVLNKTAPKIDVQKVIMALVTLISTIVASALGIKQAGLGQ